MTAFGPGTLRFGGGTAHAFEAEVTAASITHSYDEVERKATLADTAKPPARKVPGPDTLKFSLVNDLTDSGYYAYAYAHDRQAVTVEYVPNTTAGAKWDGTVTILLPDEIGAGEWGEDLESSVELPFTAPVNFTAAATVGSLSDEPDGLPE